MSVEVVEKRGKSSDKKGKKKIVIERKESSEDLLKRAKAVSPPEPPTKKKRGRPRKERPDATLQKYKENPLAVEIDKMVAFGFNATYTKGKMRPEDTQIGEALIYCGEYYGWSFFEHPILILVFAIGGTFWSAYTKAHEKSKEETKKPQEPVM